LFGARLEREREGEREGEREKERERKKTREHVRTNAHIHLHNREEMRKISTDRNKSRHILEKRT
jgi:hypothetical protein